MSPTTAAPAERARPHGGADFSRSPFIVIWEVTRACALACVHCRADAIPYRDPRELTTAEGCDLLDQVRSFADPPPLFVFTGGDPMRRPDLVDLVRHAVRTGLTVALTPSGTAAVTRKRLEELRDAGLSRVAISLDGPDAELHDSFRGLDGSFERTLRMLGPPDSSGRRPMNSRLPFATERSTPNGLYGLSASMTMLSRIRLPQPLPKHSGSGAARVSDFRLV